MAIVRVVVWPQFWNSTVGAPDKSDRSPLGLARASAEIGGVWLRREGEVDVMEDAWCAVGQRGMMDVPSLVVVVILLVFAPFSAIMTD